MVTKELKIPTPQTRMTTFPSLYGSPLYGAQFPFSGNLTTLSPQRELSQIQEHMADLFSELFHIGQNGEIAVTVQPAINLYVEEDELVIEALVPGCGKGDLQVSANPTYLTINGQISKEKEFRAEQTYWNEFGQKKRYFRAIQLPVETKCELIDAQVKNGILRLRVPVAEPSYSRNVNVSVK